IGHGALAEKALEPLIPSEEEFPYTINGKINDEALPIPSRHQFTELQSYIAPRNKIEQLLVDIWEEILGINSISVNDNFFDLGGHSLLALQLLQQIKKGFNYDMPIRSLFDFPTIDQLATAIEKYQNLEAREIPLSMGSIQSKQFMQSLINLQPMGYKKPLFLIHPVGGTIFWYLSLAKYLGIDRPIFAIQDPGLNLNDKPPFDSIEEMAQSYIRIIKSVQPEPPYFLGGASSGGIVCFEMAHQLIASGDKVEFIGLFDSWVPHPESLRRQEIFEAVMRRQYNQMHENFTKIGVENIEGLFKLQWHRVQMLDLYRVKPLNAKLFLFKAETIIPVYQPYASPLNGWENYSTSPIQLNITPGDHETIFQSPNVEILASTFYNCINSCKD
ncbi:MAG: hypothetical protein K2X39_01190, partial [Silvanigrellaceae bacterium]|nr:hypothetical protein [Silvanigrellaceae bacterium]